MAARARAARVHSMPMAIALMACAVVHAEAFLAMPFPRSSPARHRSARSLCMSSNTQAGVTSAPITSAQIRAVDAAIRRNHTAASAAQVNALFKRLERECPPLRVPLASPLPADLPGGALLRIGPNPRPGSECRGFLDGDGMLMSIVLRPPEERADFCTYSTAWVRTAGFEKEQAAGGDIFQGTIGQAPRGWPVLQAVFNNFLRGGQAVKDSCNTALSYHAGRLLARMEQCRPSELSVSRDGSIRTLKSLSDLDGAIPFDMVTGGALGAHSRVDPASGEQVCVSYATGGPGQGPPTARHDVWDAQGSLTHSATIALPAPIMIHDLAITRTHTVLFDMPLTVRIEKAFLDRFLVEYEKDCPARLGLLPRHGAPEDVVWFDVEAGVVLHAINAYDREDGCVVVQAFRAVPATPSAYIATFTPSFPYQWVLDPSTQRCVQEGYLSDVPGEFPNVNPLVHGKHARYAYSLGLSSAGGPITAYGSPQESPRFDRLVKFDLDTGSVADAYEFAHGRLMVAEPTFVCKVGQESDQAFEAREDDGYLLVLVSDVSSADASGGVCEVEASFLLVFDASDLSRGAVAEVKMPEMIPFGLHSEWLPFEGLSH